MLSKKISLLLMLPLLVLAMINVRTQTAHAAACTPPSTDYGTVTLSISVPVSATYRTWTRMAAPSTTANTYLLDVDSTSCYTVGGSSVPVYASGTTTYFATGSTNWISKTSSGTQIDLNLSAGTHTFKMIGNAANVVVDRLVLTQDTSCIPSGTGDNCANPPDTTAPVVSITSPANNTTVSGTTTVTANATDDVLVSKVEFYVDGTLRGTDTTGSSNAYTYSLSPATLGLAAGSHTLVAKAYDSSNNSASSSTVNFTVPDTTAPTISAVASGSLTQTGATVTWTTNEASDSQVEYGTTTSYGSSTTLNTTKVTAHSVSVTGLTSSTTYHYRVKSKDAAGNLATSPDATFTTQAPAGDTTAPTVSVTAPAGGSTVSGTTAVTANASDNVGVVGVQFKLDGTNLGSEDTASPYSVSWNTLNATNGTHTLTAVARDAAGNTKSATNITVTVSNSSFLAEDINMDGHVDILDFSLLSSKFGQTGTNLGRADINGDNAVNILDFSLLSSKFGS
jgi:hypothetical protein